MTPSSMILVSRLQALHRQCLSEVNSYGPGDLSLGLWDDASNVWCWRSSAVRNFGRSAYRVFGDTLIELNAHSDKEELVSTTDAFRDDFAERAFGLSNYYQAVRLAAPTYKVRSHDGDGLLLVFGSSAQSALLQCQLDESSKKEPGCFQPD